jgi:FtsZ-binding cell division protein ZapB
MKKSIHNFSLTVIIALIIMLIGSSVFAQSPEAFKYQAIARDAGGNVLANQSVSLKISILKTSDTGTPVYVETHTVTTNSFGLINLNIGTGTIVSGNFSGIDWANDKYYLKVEMDPTGGTSYQAMGTSQLLSVPYALYAKSTGNITETDPIFTNSVAHGIIGADTASWNATWKIGGNTGTIEGTNFIGTTDNKYFSIRTNNTEKVRITTKGQIETYNTGQSIFIGEGAGAYDDLSNNQNVFIGYKAGYANTSGNYNTANGYQALSSNTTGNNNTANGFKSLYSNTTGYNNTANGNFALSSNTTGNNNTANGDEALYSNTTGNYNTANGWGALYSNTTSNNNTASGWGALFSNTTGNNNTANGTSALYFNTTGYYNTANGYYALNFNTTGYGNTAYGSIALYYNVTGNNNVALGRYAGLGSSNIDFNNCTFIGANSYPTVARTNVTMLGYGIANGQCTGDNQVLLGNTSITQIRAQVSSITTYSDARMKFNIKDDVKGLDFIMKLKPVTYNEDPTILHKIWGTPDSLLKNIDHSQIKQQRFIGFLAQDVEKAAKESGFAFPGIDVPSNDKEVYSLRYVDFIMPMVKAIQEQQGMIDELKIENENLKNANSEQQKEIEKLKSDLQDLKELIINNQK